MVVKKVNTFSYFEHIINLYIYTNSYSSWPGPPPPPPPPELKYTDEQATFIAGFIT